MKLIEIASGSVLSEYDLYAAHPHTSFPSPLTASDVADLGYSPIIESTMPEYDARLQRAVAQPPQLVDGVWHQAWIIEPIPADEIASALSVRKTQLVHRIDADVDALIFKVVGNRSGEYELAEKEAAQFKAAGYVGDVPPSVQSDAVANGQSAQWSADRILATAASWRSAQSSLRSSRLLAKAQCMHAQTHSDLDAAESSWVAALADIASAL